MVQDTGSTSRRSLLLGATGRDLTVDEAASALRVLRHGAVDESISRFLLPPAIRGTVSPVISALRWAAVMFGVVFAAPDANAGDFAVIITLAVTLFHTVWRTFRPLRLADEDWINRSFVLSDSLLIGLAVGVSGGFESPFVLTVIAVIAVAAFGWGITMGIGALLTSIAGMAITGFTSNAGLNLDNRSSFTILLTILIIVGLLFYLRNRLLDAEQRRASLAGRVDSLSETNDLLSILNQVARTLPISLNLRESLDAARYQLQEAFDAKVVALLVAEENSSRWSPQLSDGCTLAPQIEYDDLPPVLRSVVQSNEPILVSDLTDGLAESSRSGVYTALRTRGKTVGVLGVEHTEPGRFGDRELSIIDGLAEVLALTVDNAKSFRRLRTLGAEEERSRIARDLHDRLGQWLTYISFELERIMSTNDTPSQELHHLYGDVQTAIDELRETLRQLRAGITEGKPLSVVAKEHLDRFANRSTTDINFNVLAPEMTMPVIVEIELFRIIQEALNNIEKHAMATEIEVIWDVDDDGARLIISDDGKGFDLARSVRESAYGLVGMRERADSIGAKLDVISAPGEGTRIVVDVPRDLRGATV